MLRRITKTGFSFLLKAPKQTLFFSRPVYTFTDIKSRGKDIDNINSIISREIREEEAQKEDLSEFTNFFQNEGWTINYDGIQVELAKTTGSYNLRILLNAKTPMNFGEESAEEADQELQDFSEFSVYIKKEGNEKWFVLDILLAGDQAQIGTATFITNYEEEKAERKRGRATPVSYSGPELSTLDEKFQESLYEFIDAVGINSEVMGRAAQLSIAYENKFYIEWLKDIKNLL